MFSRTTIKSFKTKLYNTKIIELETLSLPYLLSKCYIRNHFHYTSQQLQNKLIHVPVVNPRDSVANLLVLFSGHCVSFPMIITITFK